MDSLIGTYEDEWKRAVQDPDLRKQFRQFVNTVSVARGFDSIGFHSVTAKYTGGHVTYITSIVISADLWGQDERRPAIETISERGQDRAADWPKNFPGEKFDAVNLRTPKSEWKWVPLATVSDLQPNEKNTTSAAVRYGQDSQLAIFHVPGRGYYATQQMCPHKRAFVLDHGIVGDDKDGNLYISCP